MIHNRFEQTGLLGALVTGLLAWSTAGCGSDSPKGAAAACTPDPALVAAGRACRSDDQCPCGAGCNLGVCGAQCASSDDCAGTTCDRFGRCRAAAEGAEGAEGADDAVIPPLAVTPQHQLVVSPRFIALAAPSVANTVLVRAHGVAGEAMRVAADDGVEVRCASTGEFAKECKIQPMPVDAIVPVAVRITSATAAGTLRSARFYFGDLMQVVAITSQSQGASLPTSSGVLGGPGGLTSGVFGGQIALRALGANKDPAAPGVTMSDLVIPVTARLFLGTGGAGTLVLQDPLHLLVPTGEWTGRVAGTATDAGTVDFPTIAYLSGEASKAAGTEVLLDAPPASYSASGAAISFELVTRFAGVLMGDRRPQMRWGVVLNRTGDLPTGAVAPTVAADVAPALVAGRGLQPTPWESAIAKAATPSTATSWVSSTSGYQAQKRDLLGVFGRDTAREPSLFACNLDSGSVAALSQFAVNDAFGAELTAARHPIAAAIAASLSGKTAVTSTATLDWSAGARVMPCKVTFGAVTPSFAGACSPASESASVALSTVDLCADMAAAYGCEVVDATATTMTATADVAYTDASSCARSNHAVAIAGTVNRVCKLPVVPAACAELALCYAPVAGATLDSVKSSYAGSTQLALSGDLKCRTGGRSVAMDVDVNAELAVGDPLRLKAANIAAECDGDLAKIRDAAAPTLTSYGDGLTTAFASGRCVGAARYLYALGLATDADRRRAIDASAPSSPLASALANRLLGRWLSEHAFVAREAAEAERMAQVFRGGGSSSDPTVRPASQALAQSLAGWQLLLHPRFATAFDQMPGVLLAAPDYRPLAIGAAVAASANQEQPFALPVALLETIDAQLALADVMSEEAAFAGDAKAYDAPAQVLRQTYALRALAADMTARAVADAKAAGLPTPAWLARYELLGKSVQSVLQRILVRIDAARLGRNPLGIEPQDTPLYFFGDEATATTRFSAISDFLIGQPGGTAWVPTMVGRATASLADARTTWIAMRDRDVAVQQTQLANEQHLDALRASYGGQLADLCGGPSTLGTNELLEKWTDFDAYRCHNRSELAECRIDKSAYAALMTLDDVRYQLCYVGELRKRDKTGGMRLLDPALDALADDASPLGAAAFPAACSGGGSRDCLTYSNASGAHEIHVTPASFLFLKSTSPLLTSTDRDAAQATCRTRLPAASTTLPSLDLLPNAPASTADCFTGSIGEGVFEIRAIEKDLEIARSEASDLVDGYQIAMQSCLLQDSGNAQLADEQNKLRNSMNALGGVKLGMDIASNVCGNIKDCASAVESLSAENMAGVYGFVAMGTICVTSIAQSGFDITSLALQYSMDVAQQNFDVTVLGIQNETAKKQCANDASMSLVGVRTAALRVQRAGMDVDAAYRRQRQLQAGAQGAYDEGRAALETAKGRTIAPVSHDLWASEKISTYLDDMRRARRVTYLAVRAVEYETQQTLALEGTVLASSNPKQFQAALDELWATAATRGVNGKRPTNLKVVLSLRDQLLQLSDKSKLPASEQTLSPTERFQLMLRDSRYAVYDAAGTYKGQRIPFELAPLGALGLGQANGIPVLSGSDCAERLWSVNASIVGPAAMYQGAAPSFTRIELHKLNTFYSQWCSATDTPFQSASVRPSRNLFKEPELTSTIGSATGATGEANEYTTARIQAYFNVDQKAFEADDYANGQTAELAARGLYGKYALFIPAEMLSTKGGTGLVLNKVQDVLLRLDYVSVAR
jgi:hypothetical protein